jgi:hypothetical protein
MDSCELLGQCTFHAYLASHKPYTLEHLEDDYCNDNYAKCVRFMLYRLHGQSLVPGYLLPWDIREARKIIDTLHG